MILPTILAHKQMRENVQSLMRGRIWRVTMHSLNLNQRLGAMVAFLLLQNTNEPCVAHRALKWILGC
jgi:hypothetical protein